MNDNELQRFQLSLGEEIRRRRKLLGLSQEQLAEAMGVHRTYLGAIERGERNPALKNLMRLATALDYSLSQLFAVAEQSQSSDKGGQ